jgi:hypothetical protein
LGLLHQVCSAAGFEVPEGLAHTCCCDLRWLLAAAWFYRGCLSPSPPCASVESDFAAHMARCGRRENMNKKNILLLILFSFVVFNNSLLPMPAAIILCWCANHLR